MNDKQKYLLALKTILSGYTIYDKLKLLWDFFIYGVHKKLGLIGYEEMFEYIRGGILKIYVKGSGNKPILLRFRDHDLDFIRAGYLHEHQSMLTILRLLKEAPEEAVFIDVGAHIGKYTIAGAKMLQEKGGKVLAFEPNPQTVEELHRNLKLNRIGNDLVYVFGCALGSRTGEITLRITYDSSGSSVMNVDKPVKRKIRVQMEQLDEVLRELYRKKLLKKTQTPFFIKIDVEGASLDVIRGSKEVLRRYKPIIMFEAWTPNEASQLLQEIEKETKENLLVFRRNGTNYFVFPASKIKYFVELLNY